MRREWEIDCWAQRHLGGLVSLKEMGQCCRIDLEMVTQIGDHNLAI